MKTINKIQEWMTSHGLWSSESGIPVTEALKDLLLEGKVTRQNIVRLRGVSFKGYLEVLDFLGLQESVRLIQNPSVGITTSS